MAVVCVAVSGFTSASSVSRLLQSLIVRKEDFSSGEQLREIQAAVTGPLFVNPDNPRYFTDGAVVDGKYKAIYLTGSHTWCNFMDCGNTNLPPIFDYNEFLDFLEAHNHNFFRLWRAENVRGGEGGDNFWFYPMPYARSDTECCAFDGGNKFDLNKFNQEYFNRMRSRIQEAGERGIYVSIMLFDGWSVESKFDGHNPWKGHPYNIENNVNGVDGDVNDDGQGGEIQTLDIPQALTLEEAYIRKVVDTVNDLDNVLYEISNESTGSSGNTAWQYYVINYIKTYEASKPKQHPVGMTKQYPNESNSVLYASPADWVSPGGNITNPDVADGTKVVLADTDHLCGICGDRQWVWKSFTRGENPLFMDNYDNATSGRGIPFTNPNEAEIRTSLGFARNYAERVNLVLMTPAPDLCSTGYCLANSGPDKPEYLVFLPSGGNVIVNLSTVAGQLNVEWFNPGNGNTTTETPVAGGGSQTFIAPFSGDAVLYIYALISTTSTPTNTLVAIPTRTNTPPPPMSTRTNAATHTKTPVVATLTRITVPTNPTATKTITPLPPSQAVTATNTLAFPPFTFTIPPSPSPSNTATPFTPTQTAIVFVTPTVFTLTSTPTPPGPVDSSWMFYFYVFIILLIMAIVGVPFYIFWIFKQLRRSK